MSRRNTTIIFTSAILLSVIFINLISLREFVRIDLTKDKKYTLSHASRSTMTELEDVMVVTAYFTEGLPAPYSSYSRYVQDLLEEYRAASKGKLSFEFLDPTLEESADDKAKKKEVGRDIFGRLVREPTSIESELMEVGIEPVEIRVIEDDQQQTKRAYLGVVLRYGGKQEVIPVIQDIANLEKDLTLLMRKLVRKKTPVLALISDVPDANLAKWKKLAAESVEIKEIQFGQPGNHLQGADALALVGSGQNLSESAIQEIDQFIRSGKGVAFLVDRFELNFQSFQVRPYREVSNSPLFELLSKYGVDVGNDLVADVSCAVLNMNEQRGGMLFTVPVRYPFIPEIANVDQESPIGHGLSGLMLPFTSSLQVKGVGGLKASVLAKSGKTSWLETMPLNTDPKREWRRENVSPTGPHPLLVELNGRLDATEQSVRVFVAGTSAFLWEHFLAGPNQALALNLVDWLMADSALLAMRSRSHVDLPLNPDVGDDVRTAIKYGNILGVPMLLVAYGLVRWSRREKRRRGMHLSN